jgi:hypothetical protein
MPGPGLRRAEQLAQGLCAGVLLNSAGKVNVNHWQAAPFCRQALEKRPSAALRSSFVFAAYATVRLIPHDVARLASAHF